MMKRFDESNYLLSASTPGEDRWTETGGPTEEGGLVPGHAYSVIQVKEAFGNKLLNLRNPWGTFEWNGDWGDNSTKWTN
jgi:calpain-15